MAQLPPWPRFGGMACAASPTIATRPADHRFSLICRHNRHHHAALRHDTPHPSALLHQALNENREPTQIRRGDDHLPRLCRPGDQVTLTACVRCGQTTTGEVCAFCKLGDQVRRAVAERADAGAERRRPPRDCTDRTSRALPLIEPADAPALRGLVGELEPASGRSDP